MQLSWLTAPTVLLLALLGRAFAGDAVLQVGGQEPTLAPDTPQPETTVASLTSFEPAAPRPFSRDASSAAGGPPLSLLDRAHTASPIASPTDGGAPAALGPNSGLLPIADAPPQAHPPRTDDAAPRPNH